MIFTWKERIQLWWDANFKIINNLVTQEIKPYTLILAYTEGSYELINFHQLKEQMP